MLAKMNLNLNSNKTYQFDIDEIENIKIFVVIEHEQYLRIRARNIINCNECAVIYTKRILEKNEKIYTEVHLDKIIDILNNLKFDKIKGEFYLSNIDKPTTIEELNEKNKFYKKLNSNIKVIKIYDECSICFEYTICKSKCGHFLCYECWSQVKFNDCADCRHHNGEVCDDAQCGKQRCPVCRQGLTINSL
jgi:virulence-associated protein VapD